MLAKIVQSLYKGDRLLPRFSVGHAVLKYYLHKLGKADDQICRPGWEMAEHILYECPDPNLTQHQHFSRLLLTSSEVQDLNPRLILRFVTSLELV